MAKKNATKPEASKPEAPKKALPKWKYTGKYPTWVCGRLIHPGNVIEAAKKPGKDFKKL